MSGKLVVFSLVLTAVWGSPSVINYGLNYAAVPTSVTHQTRTDFVSRPVVETFVAAPPAEEVQHIVEPVQIGSYEKTAPFVQVSHAVVQPITSYSPSSASASSAVNIQSRADISTNVAATYRQPQPVAVSHQIKANLPSQYLGRNPFLSYYTNTAADRLGGEIIEPLRGPVVTSYDVPLRSVGSLKPDTQLYETQQIAVESRPIIESRPVVLETAQRYVSASPVVASIPYAETGVKKHYSEKKTSNSYSSSSSKVLKSSSQNVLQPEEVIISHNPIVTRVQPAVAVIPKTEYQESNSIDSRRNSYSSESSSYSHSPSVSVATPTVYGHVISSPAVAAVGSSSVQSHKSESSSHSSSAQYSRSSSISSSPAFVKAYSQFGSAVVPVGGSSNVQSHSSQSSSSHRSEYSSQSHSSVKTSAVPAIIETPVAVAQDVRYIAKDCCLY